MTPTGSLGVKRSEKPTGALELFPNPALDRATVRIGHPLRAGASASVRDLLGRLVQRVELDPGSPQIDISGLPPGNYLVELVEGNERYAGRIAKR